jgi:hypothetical protein
MLIGICWNPLGIHWNPSENVVSDRKMWGSATFCLREVRATDSFNVTKSDGDDWRRHRDDYVSRKLAKETEDQSSIAMADDAKAAKAAELLRKALTKPEHYDGN